MKIDEHVRDCYRCRFRLSGPGAHAVCALNERSLYVNTVPMHYDDPVPPPEHCPLREEPVQINVSLSQHAPEPST